MAYIYISVVGLKNAKIDGTNVSIAASCFNRVAELEDQGFDESVIRSMTSTMCMGKTICWRYTLEYSPMKL